MSDQRAQASGAGIPDSGLDLEGQVDALLAEIDRAVETVLARGAEVKQDAEDALLDAIAAGAALSDVGADEPGPAEPAEADTEAVLDEAMAALEQTAETAPAKAGTAEAQIAQSVAEDLLSAGIDSLLDSVGDTPAGEKPSSFAAVDVSGRTPSEADLAIDQLDHELATLIKDEIRESAPAPEATAATAQPMPATAPAAVTEPAKPAFAAPAVAPTAPSARPAEARGRPTLPKDRDARDWIQWALGMLRWAAPIAWKWLHVRVMALAVRGEPVLARGIDLTGKPFEGRPAIIRSIVGWFAIYTGFVAMCVWTFVLFFREVKTPERSESPVTLVSETNTSGTSRTDTTPSETKPE